MASERGRQVDELLVAGQPEYVRGQDWEAWSDGLMQAITVRMRPTPERDERAAGVVERCMPDSLVLQWRAHQRLQDLWPARMLDGDGTQADPYVLNDVAVKTARDAGEMPSTSHRMQVMAEMLGATAGGVRGMAPLLALRARAGNPGRLVAFVDYFIDRMVLVKTSCGQWTDENLRDSGIDDFEENGAFMTGLFFNALDRDQQNVVLRDVTDADSRLRFGRGMQGVHKMVKKLRREGLLGRPGAVSGVGGRRGRTGGVHAVVPPPVSAPAPPLVKT